MLALQDNYNELLLRGHDMYTCKITEHKKVLKLSSNVPIQVCTPYVYCLFSPAHNQQIVLCDEVGDPCFAW